MHGYDWCQHHGAHNLEFGTGNAIEFNLGSGVIHILGKLALQVAAPPTENARARLVFEYEDTDGSGGVAWNAWMTHQLEAITNGTTEVMFVTDLNIQISVPARPSAETTFADEGGALRQTKPVRVRMYALLDTGTDANWYVDAHAFTV